MRVRGMLNLGVLVLVLALDLRDFFYKYLLLGPGEWQAFEATETFWPADSSLSRSPSHRACTSGWCGLAQACLNVTPMVMGPGGFALMAMAVNCSQRGVQLPAMILASSMRVDSMVWASCALLERRRRPALCQRSVVSKYLPRYKLDASDVSWEWVARPETPEEAELMGILELAAESTSLSSVVCWEGFALNDMVSASNASRSQSTVFACGSSSPSLPAAFAGQHATSLLHLVRDKAWLTLDELNVQGLQYSIRQNALSYFETTMAEPDGLHVTHTTRINFSCAGKLYGLAILIDIILVITSAIGTVEMVSLMLREGCHHDGRPAYAYWFDDSLSLHARTTCRSSMMVLLTFVSQMLGWMVVLPNAIIWANGGAWQGQLQAYMTSGRAWILVLFAVNRLWDWVVQMNEAAAMAVVKLTYINTFEIIGVVVVIAYFQYPIILTLASTKYALESQRCRDTTTSTAFTLYYNCIPDPMDGQAWTSPEVLTVIYGPLAMFVGSSTCCILVLASVKLAYFRAMRQNMHRMNATSSAGPTSLDVVRSIEHKPYQRLELEERLDTAIRARSLVRTSFALDHHHHSNTFVHPIHCLEFGLYYERGRARSRWGFVNAVPFQLDIKSNLERKRRKKRYNPVEALDNDAEEKDELTDSEAIVMPDQQDEHAFGASALETTIDSTDAMRQNVTPALVHSRTALMLDPTTGGRDRRGIRECSRSD